MAEKKNPLGPTGDRVKDNITHFRTVRGLSYKELSDRLASIDRSIPVLGLSRVERGERRVDADDLVALAVALNVSPARLLLSGGDDESAEIPLTSAVKVPAGVAWPWVRGEAPIAAVAVASGHPDMTLGEMIDDFERHSLPGFERRFLHRDHTAVRGAKDVLERVWMVLDQREELRRDGYTDADRAKLRGSAASLRRALKRLTAEIDDLIGDDDDGDR
ncbi:helix-turn-helix domain-containing protein [Micromonospora chersina]|uniref:helix-turn-helix domain-containing protein n=1 Tax=Micromonospora chersina TaxID=47854 RepID=UPI00371E8734